jgi:hypothetical protein
MKTAQRIGPITWDEVLSSDRYSGRISQAERERLQPLTTAALRRAPVTTD